MALIWFVGLFWCCGVLVAFGYVAAEQRPDVPELVWGIPSWVFWGLFAPWIVLIGATWWFALMVLKDDEPYMDFPAGMKSGGQGSGRADTAETAENHGSAGASPSQTSGELGEDG